MDLTSDTESHLRGFLDSSGYESDIENCQSMVMSGPPRSRRRRDRTQFSEKCIARLESIFRIDRYPDVIMRESLSEELGVTEDRIQVWFQNRRSKHRRNLQPLPEHKINRTNQEPSRCNSHGNLTLPPLRPAQATLPIPALLDPFRFSLLHSIQPLAALLSQPFTLPIATSLAANTRINEQLQSSNCDTTDTSLDSSNNFTRQESDGETSKENEENTTKHDDNTLFKRPWEPSQSDRYYRQSKTDISRAAAAFGHMPLAVPPFMLAAPPLLPFSALGHPGTGLLFLPQTGAGFQR